MATTILQVKNYAQQTTENTVETNRKSLFYIDCN